MPLDFTQHDDHLALVASGEYTADEVVEAYDRAFSALPAGRRTPFLVDVRSSTTMLGYEGFRRMMTVYERHIGVLGPRFAVVVADEGRFAGARQSGMMLEELGIDSRPFTDPEEARAWITGGGDGDP